MKYCVARECSTNWPERLDFNAAARLHGRCPACGGIVVTSNKRFNSSPVFIAPLAFRVYRENPPVVLEKTLTSFLSL